MLLEEKHSCPFRKSELRGSGVRLQEEKVDGEVLTPEVDFSPRKERRSRGAQLKCRYTACYCVTAM